MILGSLIRSSPWANVDEAIDRRRGDGAADADFSVRPAGGASGPDERVEQAQVQRGRAR